MIDPNHDIVPTLRMFDGVMMGKAADEIESLRVQVAELKKDNDAYKEANEKLFNKLKELQGNSVQAVNEISEAMLQQYIKLKEKSTEVIKDAARYQWLREQHWSGGVIAVVLAPKRTVKLGADCPSGVQLDRIIDNRIG